MTKPLRRDDRRLDTGAALALLTRGEYGILSTTDDHHAPYGIPVNYVMMEGSIYLHCAPEGHKLDNISVNDRVSFCVVGRTELLPAKFSTRYESVIVTGRAEVVDDAILKKNALRALIQKYASEHITAGEDYIDKLIGRVVVVRIDIDHVTGKARK